MCTSRPASFGRVRNLLQQAIPVFNMDRNVVVVDLGDFDNRKAEITAALMDAASRIGFFQVWKCVKSSAV